MSKSRADRQWNNWDGGAAASMGDYKPAGSLNNRGPTHDKSLAPAAGPTRLRTHNDTDTGYAEK